jgi:hypothetical protein
MTPKNTKTIGKILTIALFILALTSIIILSDRYNQLPTLFIISFMFFLYSLYKKIHNQKAGQTPLDTPSIPFEANIEVRINEKKEENPKLYAKYQTLLGLRRSIENDLGISIS